MQKILTPALHTSLVIATRALYRVRNLLIVTLSSTLKLIQTETTRGRRQHNEDAQVNLRQSLTRTWLV